MKRCPSLCASTISSFAQTLFRFFSSSDLFSSASLLTGLLSFSLLFFSFVIFSPPAFAQSYALYDLNALVSNTVPSAWAGHTVSFSLPINSQPIVATDYIQINLPYFSGVTPATSISGTYSGTPVFSISGNTVRVTGINVQPGKEITIQGYGAYNPAAENDFLVIVSVTEDEAGLIVKNTGSTYATRSPYRVKISASVDFQDSRLRIEGYTAPSTYIIFTEGESVRGTDFAGPTGFFAKVFPAITVDTHTYTFYGIDTENRTTTSKSITAYTPAYQMITIQDQLLSPTIEISDNDILVGQELYATGSAYPGSTINIFTDTPVRNYTASASASGNWTTTINTSAYTPGDYRIYALAQTDGGLQSLISPTILFTVRSTTGGGGGTACGDISTGDINCDDIVDLTDFSILMYYWGTTNATADVNSDGLVDLTDFSILMYYWGT